MEMKTCIFCNTEPEYYRLYDVLTDDLHMAPICRKCYGNLPVKLPASRSRYIILGMENYDSNKEI